MKNTSVLITDVSDGETIKEINGVVDSFYTVFHVTCFTDTEGTIPVSATAGTLLITVADDGFNYGSIQSDSSDGMVDLTIQDYFRPYMFGYMQSFKVSLSGVTGCSSIRVVALTGEA